jgi:serine/threonine protein kinase
VKIADFGFSAYSHSDNLSEWLGTPPYMAPELVTWCPQLSLTKQTYGRAVDIWAIGVIFYILLSGIHPFQTDDDMRMFNRIMNGKVAWISSSWSLVSNSAKELILGMLTPNPAQRLTIDQCILHPWLTSAIDEGLDVIQDALRDYQARKTFKAVILGVLATNKMKILMSRLSTLKSLSITLKVKIHSGRDLAVKDMNGFSDPYILLFYVGNRYKTKIIKKSLNPVWEEEFLFPFKENTPLYIQCWDYDFIGSDDFMGEIIITAKQISSFPYSMKDWFVLGQRTVDKKGLLSSSKYKSEIVSGAIHITLSKIQT